MSTTQSSRQQPQTAAASRRRASGRSRDQREHAPMPRSTTRVIWTTTEGATVVYGEIA